MTSGMDHPPPPGWIIPLPVEHELSDDELRASIRERVAAGEASLIEQRAASGKRVLGMRRVWQQS
jgi:hypothetical protein